MHQLYPETTLEPMAEERVTDLRRNLDPQPIDLAHDTCLL
jgi:hypothetical protein